MKFAKRIVVLETTGLWYHRRGGVTVLGHRHLLGGRSTSGGTEGSPQICFAEDGQERFPALGQDIGPWGTKGSPCLGGHCMYVRVRAGRIRAGDDGDRPVERVDVPFAPRREGAAPGAQCRDDPRAGEGPAADLEFFCMNTDVNDHEHGT